MDVNSLIALAYNEFLPALIGENVIEDFPSLFLQSNGGQLAGKLSVDVGSRSSGKGLRAEMEGSHSGPPPEDQPTIRNEFATALFRYGHSMQPNVLQARNQMFEATENRLMRYDIEFMT